MGSDSQEKAGDLGWGGQEGLSEMEPLKLGLKGQGLGKIEPGRLKSVQRPWGRIVPGMLEEQQEAHSPVHCHCKVTPDKPHTPRATFPSVNGCPDSEWRSTPAPTFTLCQPHFILWTPISVPIPILDTPALLAGGHSPFPSP